MGRGILRTEEMVFLDNANPALRLAIKVESVRYESVNKKVKTKKTKGKIAFCLMKARDGDQKSTPATKIPANTRLMTLPKLKQEFINSWGFSV